MRLGIKDILTWTFIALTAMTPALANQPGASADDASASDPPLLPGSDPLPAQFQGVGVDEQLGDLVPADIRLTDEEGRTVTLGDYLDGERPAILILGYYECPMLCSLVLNAATTAMKEIAWTPGQEYEVIFVSIDPRESHELARTKKANYVADLDRPGAERGWHFLTGEQDQITRLAQAVGFQYRYIKDKGQYSHPAVVTVLTPQGKVARYLYGLHYDPEAMRLSLAEASEGKVLSTLDRVLLFCLQYDSETGKYTWAAVGLMRAGGVLTLLVLVSGIGVALYRESHQVRAVEKKEEDGPEV